MPPVYRMFAQHVQITPFEPSWMNQIPWFGWVAIVAILSGCVTTVVTGMIRHRERMAMIQLGMHPDTPPPTEHLSTGKPFARESTEL